jgi:hypothetical protein
MYMGSAVYGTILGSIGNGGIDIGKVFFVCYTKFKKKKTRKVFKIDLSLGPI